MKSRDPFNSAIHAWCLLLLAMNVGCQSFSNQFPSWNDPFGQQQASAVSSTDADVAAGGVVQVSAEETTWDRVSKQSTRLANFVQGKEQENASRAKQLYQQGDALFRRASALPREEAMTLFDEAAEAFQKAGEAAPETAIEQDALYMQGESLFFADRLTAATDAYQRLQKEFPRNKHNDRVAARLFSISRYWIDVDKATEDDWFPLSFFDRKRPVIDVDGHAIRVLDQIRYDDPTGRLADDATMAAAAEFIRQRKFEDADEFLMDLRESFPDSEHLFMAHMLGIRCKLEIYNQAGADYSAAMLDAAEKLVRQTRQRFPDKLREKNYADMLARSAAEIESLLAEKLLNRAEFRDKQRGYGAAREYYQKILDEHPETPLAEKARTRLQSIADAPAKPARRLSWLQAIFPSKNSNLPPLEPTFPVDQTLLR